jgi:hypothetical protein
LNNFLTAKALWREGSISLRLRVIYFEMSLRAEETETRNPDLLNGISGYEILVEKFHLNSIEIPGLV